MRELVGAVLLCVLTLGACREDEGTADSCEGIASRIERICGEGFGSIEAERFRYDCGSGEVYLPSELSCLSHATECEQSLEACNFRELIRACSADDLQCDPGLRCDVDSEECVVCLADEECDPGRLCVAGYCVRDTPTNRSLHDLSQSLPDAGAASP